MLPGLFWLVPIGSVLALVFAWIFFKQLMGKSEGTETMARIASHVRRGAMAYLKQQYKVVGVVFAVLTGIFALMAFGFNPPFQNEYVWFAFLTGGFFSGSAGFFEKLTTAVAVIFMLTSLTLTYASVKRGEKTIMTPPPVTQEEKALPGVPETPKVDQDQKADFSPAPEVPSPAGSEGAEQ